jgi:hypothetical protein
LDGIDEINIFFDNNKIYILRIKMDGYCNVTGSTRCRCERKDKMIPSLHVDFRFSISKLFIDHAYGIKSMIDLIALNQQKITLPEVQVLYTRLMEGSDDIGNQIKNFIRKDDITFAFKKQNEYIAEYLKSVVLGYDAYLRNDVFTNNAYTIQNNVKMMYTNSERIAQILTQTKTSYFYELRELYFRYVKLVIEMMSHKLSNNYVMYYKVCDAFVNHMILISDVIHNISKL